MPYVDEVRPYEGQVSDLANHRVAPPWFWFKNGVQTPYFEDPVDSYCTERTRSYRTTRASYSGLPVMTGEDIRNAIYHGDEIVIDPRAPGGVAETGEEIRYDGVLDSKWDSGHEFTTQKIQRHLWTSVDLTRQTSGTLFRYRGHLMPYWYGKSSYPTARPFDLTTEETLRIQAEGNRAIVQSSPTAPEASLANFVAELLMLPTIPILHTLRGGIDPRAIGGEYLNVVFGWRPFIRDVQKLMASVTISREIVEQMLRDAGRGIRRRRHMVADAREVKVTQADLSMSIPRVDISGRGWDIFASTSSRPGQVLDTSVENMWFSGSFSYFLYETDTLLGRLMNYEAAANRVLGSRFDLDTLWEITPWSWLIDWFGDLQSFITRHVRLANDNLVLRYGYVMRQLLLERTLMCPNWPLFVGGVVPTPQLTTQILRKERLRSTPYGFGLDMSALSAERWAILGALGLTRSPRSLRSS